MPDAREERRPHLPRMLREPEVAKITGLAAITIYKLERAGRFPRRRRLTGRAVGWREDEVREWIESRERVKLGSESEG